MIDTTKFPFEVDHNLCLNCQVVSRLTKEERDGTKFDGSTWQKGIHLCSSCQWHCAMLALDTRRDSAIKRELRSLEHEIYDLTGEWIYFDEKTPKDVLEELQKVRYPDNHTTEAYTDVINSLQKIIELGFNKLVC